MYTDVYCGHLLLRIYCSNASLIASFKNTVTYATFVKIIFNPVTFVKVISYIMLRTYISKYELFAENVRVQIQRVQCSSGGFLFVLS